MKNRIFYIIVAITCLIGCIFTGILISYTLNLANNSSITAFIANEE